MIVISMKNVFILIGVFALLILYFRYIESRSIYFPMKHIEYTPDCINLRYEDVSFTTSDGVELHGWLVPSAGKKPTVLFCHGNAGNISHRIEVLELFHEIGLQVFIFDYRGYGKSGGRPSESGTYRDAQAAYQYLISKGLGDSRTIIAYGESLGGAVAVDLARKVPLGALIVEGTFTSAPDMAKTVFPFLPVRLFMKTQYDSLSKIGAISVPTLVIHSKDDEIIPFRQGLRLYEKAGGPKSFLEMRGGHNYAVLLAKERFKEAIRKFLTQHAIL